MTVEPGSSQRQIVPRWRPFRQTAQLGELDNLQSARVSDREVAEMQQLLDDWESGHGISKAAEIAGAALALRQPNQGREAAAYILNRSDEALPTEVELAHSVLGDEIEDGVEARPAEDDEHGARSLLGLQRAFLRDDLRNPIAWAEMARGYTVLGQRDHASDAMKFAVKLAPNNRYILRSAARMHIHQGEPDRAHRLILKSFRVKSDPWLVAVELATAQLAEESPRLVRAAKALIEDRSWPPRHLTELAAAMGTLELNGGHDRDARRYFRRALDQANENSLAQIEWASQQTSGLDITAVVRQRPEAHEARARANLNDGHWAEAAESTWAWYYDQPFSSEAAISGSYGTGVGGDFQQSVRFADVGLRANPGNEVLLNNAAFALLQLDQIEQARYYLSRVNIASLKDRHLVANLATRGLLEYRVGEADAGRQLYFEAVTAADRYRPMQAMAAILMALEEFRVHSRHAVQVGTLAARLSTAIDEPAVNEWRARLVQQLTEARE